MEFGGILLAVNILLLTAGWYLFNQARAELNARAAEMPILTEVRSLEQRICALIEQLRQEADRASAQLDARCLDAREQLAALERRLEEFRQATQRGVARRREAVVSQPPVERAPAGPPSGASGQGSRFAEVRTLAGQGLTPQAIAERTGLSEGEVDLILAVGPAAPRDAPRG